MGNVDLKKKLKEQLREESFIPLNNLDRKGTHHIIQQALHGEHFSVF